MTDKLLIKIQADTNKAIKDVNKLTKEVKTLSKESKQFGKSAKDVEKVNKSFTKLNTSVLGVVSSVALAYSAITGVGKLVSVTSELEKGFIGVAKTTGLAGEEFENLKEEIFDLSTEMSGVKTTELQEIAAIAGQLGIQGKENIIEFTRIISMMAISTELSAGDAATAMAKLGVSLGVPIEEFEKLGSTINELSNSTTATATDILEVTQRLSGMGTTLGLSRTEILGFSATLKDIGLSSEVAGTALSQMFSKMLIDTNKFAKVAGVSLSEFSQIVEEKPIEAIEKFLVSLGKLDKQARVDALKELGLSGGRVAGAMLKLSTNTDLLNKNLDLSAKAWKQNTSLQKEYTTASKGIEAQWERLKNTFNRVLFTVGGELNKELKKLIDNTVEWMQTLDSGTLASFGKSLGTIATTLGGIAKTVAFLNDIAMPDILGGKDAGLIDTAAKGWGRLGESLSDTQTTYQTLVDMENWLDNVNEIEALINSYDGLEGSYADLTRKVSNLLATNHKLQEQFRGDASEFARSKLAELRAEEDRVFDITEKLAKQRPHDALAESAKSAKKDVQDLNQEAKEPIEVTVDAKTESYAAKMKRLRDEGKQRPIVARVDADTKDADTKIAKSKKTASETVVTTVDFKPNTSAVDSARRVVSKPITVPVTYVPTNSPPPGTGFASGGYTGSGGVNEVAGVVHKGEFVLPASAVKSIGIDKLYSLMSNLKFPKLPGYANGGLVGASSVPSALTPINLSIGGNSFSVMSDAEVAASLTRYINSQGGI